jgi:hypothetical protein
MKADNRPTRVIPFQPKQTPRRQPTDEELLDELPDYWRAYVERARTPEGRAARMNLVLGRRAQRGAS